MRVEDLTIEEIEQILKGGDERKKEEFQAYVNAFLAERGFEGEQEAGSQFKEVQAGIAEWSCHVQAQRIKAGLSGLDPAQDLPWIVNSVIEEATEEGAGCFPAHERDRLRSSTVDALTGTLGPKICEEGLKKQIERVEAVVSLATEKGMSVTDFLALEDAEDRITRRTIPKRRDYLERSQAEKSSIEGLPELFRELVISLTSNLMGVEESELEREMTDSREVRAAMDTARQRTAAVSDALGEWYEKEADRIYGPPAQAET